MKKSGDKGEIIAIEYLKKNGFEIIDTNFKFSRFGEIDIVGKKEDLTIFFEVKYRSNNFFGIGEESITKSKLFKLSKTINYYVLTHKLDFEKIRFDIITILKEEKSYKLTHYRNQSLV
ncbi:YraN family protein [Candidatus Gracilibacteria bacterium]|nr:YraN family protein [Candidatus Gracilibacteria bacterium]